MRTGKRPASGVTSSGHAFVEHTGEVEVHLEADSVGDLLVEAARALADLVLEEADPRDAEGEAVPVTVDADDPEALLVDWLNELVFLGETRGQALTEVSVDEARDGHVTARVRGRSVAGPRTAVKAATFHGLRLVETDGRWQANVVLDV